MSREVLPATCDAVGPKAQQNGPGQGRYGHWIRTERSVPDDRVLRVGVKVQDRGEIAVDTHGREFFCDHLGSRMGEGVCVRVTECLGFREECESRRQPPNPAPLLIDADQHGQGCARFLEFSRETVNLVRVFQVSLEKDHAAGRVMAEEISEVSAQLRPVETNDEELSKGRL